VGTGPLERVEGMKLSVQGKNVDVSDWMLDYIDKKIGKLDRYLPSISEALVEVSEQDTRSAKDRQIVQVTLSIKNDKALLRAEERSGDLTAAVDSVLDKLYRQISRYKGKRLRRRGAPEQGEPPPLEEEGEEPEGAVVRVKRFRMNPMSEDEAIEQMELLGHDFFVFYNPDASRVNVLYRRRDGDFGLIDPELA